LLIGGTGSRRFVKVEPIWPKNRRTAFPERQTLISQTEIVISDSEEKHEPVSDIDTAVVDSLKALDQNGRLEKQTWRNVGGSKMIEAPI
jgi:hypothetical protein